MHYAVTGTTGRSSARVIAIEEPTGAPCSRTAAVTVFRRTVPTIAPAAENARHGGGWVNYFAVGHSSECFSFIKDWVEKKVRRQLAHAQKRKGFGWERWSSQWLYDTLGLFNGYRVRRDRPKVAPAG